MKNYLKIIIFVALFLGAGSANQGLQLQFMDVAAELALPFVANQGLQLQYAEASDFTWFKIASFDKQDNKTDLGGNISLQKGKSGSCAFEYTDKERDSGKGYSLKITYDVDVAKQALQLQNDGDMAKQASQLQDDGVGIKIDLKMPDLTNGHYNLVFLVKGDKTAGYTTRFKVKLESPGKEAIQIADDVIGEWKQIYLPFSMFKGDIDWNKVNSIYIIFDKDTVTEKKGIIYIDTIFLN